MPASAIKNLPTENLKTVNVVSVESIPESAFYNSKNLKSVSMSSIKEIGESAFRGCSGLTETTISEKSASIGYNEFYEYVNLIKMNIKDIRFLP